jgi:hypothetical protein
VVVYPFPYLVANTPLKPTRAALPVKGGQGRCHHCAQSSIRTSQASWGPLGARLGPHDRALNGRAGRGDIHTNAILGAVASNVFLESLTTRHSGRLGTT